MLTRLFVVVVLLGVGACKGTAQDSGGGKSKKVLVAAASDLSVAFEEIGRRFREKTGTEVVVSPGATGLLTKQISEGAPYDIFFAANKSFAEKAAESGACDPATLRRYARGHLVVWTSGEGPTRFAELADPRWKRIAIANPEVAPYGKAAKQALEKAGVWEAVAGRIALSENVRQSLQWAQSGNADAAIVALSLATATKGGASLAVDGSLHDPLDQALIVCKNGGNRDAAVALGEFVTSPEGREILARYGFAAPQ